MEEEKIIVKIDENGNVTSEVKGVVGPSCVNKIEDLLRDIAEIEDMKKTDGYYMDVEVLQNTKTSTKTGRKK